MAALESSLRQEAAKVYVAPAPGLEARIGHAVDRSARQPQRRTERNGWSWRLATGLAAMSAAVVLVQLQKRHSVPAAESAATVQDVLEVASDLNRNWIGSVQPNALKMVQSNPLQTEIASVRSDARSALNFLALNFLPKAGDEGTTGMSDSG
jgi:hypothetical protein